VYSYKISAVYQANSLALSDHLQGEVLDTDVHQVSEADTNARIEDFDPDQVTVGIKIDHNALFHFFAPGHLSLFEVHIEGIRRLAVFYFHAQPPVLVAFIHGADHEKLFLKPIVFSPRDSARDLKRRKQILRLIQKAQVLVEGQRRQRRFFDGPKTIPAIPVCSIFQHFLFFITAQHL
jgi:hypothetical protein